MAAAGPAFLAVIPITNYATAPNGIVQKAVETLISLIPKNASIASDRVIPALSAFYIFWTFAATGAASAAGLAASKKEGLDNNRMYHNLRHAVGTRTDTRQTLVSAKFDSCGWLTSKFPDPRKDTSSLTGFPLRLRSAHYNTMEMFPVLSHLPHITILQILTSLRASHSQLLWLKCQPQQTRYVKFCPSPHD